MGQWKGGRRVTYCRFRSYSCGDTVIISPLLLNSLILSYISGARGQEILQFINRTTLSKGGLLYGIYPNLFVYSMSFFPRRFAVLPRLCLSPVVPDWILSRGSVTATQRTRCVTCFVLAYHPSSVFYRSHGEGGCTEIGFPVGDGIAAFVVEVNGKEVCQHQNIHTRGLKRNLHQTKPCRLAAWDSLLSSPVRKKSVVNLLEKSVP